MEWADLVTLDLSTFDNPGGKEALAKQLFDALQTTGFFYIVNFGLSQEEVDRQFAIGKSVFELPDGEKLKYRADLENGGYNGYKPLGLRVRFCFFALRTPNIMKLTARRKSPPESLTIPKSTTSQSSSHSSPAPTPP